MQDKQPTKTWARGLTRYITKGNTQSWAVGKARNVIGYQRNANAHDPSTSTTSSDDEEQLEPSYPVVRNA